MMKKMVALGAILFALSASADILYWQVEKPTYTATSTSVNYSQARVLADTDNDAQGGTVLSLIVAGKDSSTATVTSVDSAAFATTVAANLVNGNPDYGSSSYYFYIELLDASDNVIAVSAAQSYSDISRFTSDASFSASWASAQTWSVSSFAAPEPTSGLLMLIGAALLGLKRRKVA